MAILELVFGIILVISIIGGITINNYLKRNQGQMRSLEREFGARLARLEALEERIGVIERIVTDKRYDLRQQFHDLEKTG